ncbi:hypothetical protein C8Q75DRAFT_799232 [Abortiporus biennis]|nr:hypothetical protein C8Q75DRAFT_799232 [Abortiporus biennis]
MSDPRFARLKTDPRFRKIKKHESKVVVDERFKSVFDKGKKKKDKGKVRVDKYGRKLTETHEEDTLRRFYRLENEDEENEEAEAKPIDYARGEVLLESSDEEDEADEESDDGGVITLGRDVSKPIPIPEDEFEIDLDEDIIANLDAQAAAYEKENPQTAELIPEADRTRRIAVVNLDWDHVRASHLYKIFSSLVSPSAPPKSKAKKDSGTKVVRGKVLNVRVYPSQFGKERMAREEKEGPPAEVFKKKELDEDEINEKTIYETGDGEDYDEDALRKYQLERLRYYYAIVECDTIEAASHIYTELEGTELERSANVFDLSFVPEDMTFDDEFRDEATDDLNVPYKGLEFVTDALRHSKVKLTWDEDDPERNQLTRRTLSKKEIEENDFKAYIASSGSEDEDEDVPQSKASRDKLRALLLSGGDDALPEGWGKGEDDERDVDMQITFTPGLSKLKDDQDETTLEKYQRKMKEKKKKRKDELKEKHIEKEQDEDDVEGIQDDFFAAGSDEDSDGAVEETDAKKSKKAKKEQKKVDDPSRKKATAEELQLLVGSDNSDDEHKHFDMKAVIKSEKLKGKKKRRKGRKAAEMENELQEDFKIDVQDDRFKAIHEDYSFAIDPSNPHFKKTKSMSALLEERARRRKDEPASREDRTSSKTESEPTGASSLQSLVERVKRKSAAAAEDGGVGKRRRL